MNTSKAHEGTPYRFSYYNLRNVTGPNDTEYKTYVGLAPVTSIVDVSIEENVRGYLLDNQLRRTPTTVHKAIRGSLDNTPEIFHLLHSGITLVARDAEVADQKKFIKLLNPSIINGAQTQGVVREYLADLRKERERAEKRLDRPLSDPTIPTIRFEIIVTDDQEVIDNVSIARNMQDDVLQISIANKSGHLDELDAAFKKAHPSLQLRLMESDRPNERNNIVPTEKLLQIIAALAPKQLLVKREPSKIYAYSQKTRCLKDFIDLRVKANSDERAKELYQYYLDVCGEAWSLYLKWQSTNIPRLRERAVIRENGDIFVADGIVFPMLAGFSIFAKKTPDGWKLNVPDNDAFVRLVTSTASTAYQQLADRKPHLMGRNKACYDMIEENIEIMLDFFQET